MRVLFFVSFFVLTQVLAFGQVIVGKFHLSVTGKDYVVMVDDMHNRYKGKMPNEQLKKCQIYLQVETNNPGIDAFIKITSSGADNFVKNLANEYAKAGNKTKNRFNYRKSAGDGEVELYMRSMDETTHITLYGYESDQDFNKFYERNDEGTVFLSYIGETSKSEGEDGLTISGWRLTLSSVDEVNALCDLVLKAQTMIKNNSID